ncbi:helix-turn-helix domain-containing protein [Aquisediminimonas sediminicola]|uniref:helix-turn-helix domain-containing protein n=1 Tax=Alteraquisediminimonas sediminicola TaxID=2676787 RepID=UPI001C8D21E9|nr:helix-turn-helix transcriptional regulator [Aquisediminimonas sediminicola]
MITAIRQVRKAKGMTLADVAARCAPPTTAQTIGRLETGMRTVSVEWLNRIATALGVTASDLVTLPDQSNLPVIARIGADGAQAPERELALPPPQPMAEDVAVQILVTVGEYRSGDVLWCRRTAPADFAAVLNRDILVPRPAGRFVFGRMIGLDADRILILPPGAGHRQQVVAGAPWIAVAHQLVRSLD